jgi:hypothetical protein
MNIPVGGDDVQLDDVLHRDAVLARQATDTSHEY